jgi:hypothetical protein
MMDELLMKSEKRIRRDMKTLIFTDDVLVEGKDTGQI